MSVEHEKYLAAVKNYVNDCTSEEDEEIMRSIEKTIKVSIMASHNFRYILASKCWSLGEKQALDLLLTQTKISS